MTSWWDHFWFAETPPHIFAVLRILFGLMGLLVLAGLLDLPLFWSCDGLVASRETALCRDLSTRELAWLPGVAVLTIASLSFALMTIGLGSRVVVVFAYVSVTFIARWNNLPLSSATQVLRSLMFCLMFADSGRVWSADAWRRRRHSNPPTEKKVPIWPLQLIRLQVALIYLVTGLWKLQNAAWREGTALHFVFENPQFSRFPMLRTPALDPWTTALTYFTLVWELAFAFLVMFPRTRRLAVGFGVVIHLGMWLTMELGPFSAVMLASYVAFADPVQIRSIIGRLRPSKVFLAPSFMTKCHKIGDLSDRAG